jgi:dTDP-4-amino-4,6-dideoxygalactose transaminase
VRGRIGIFSFNGNKIITTSGGGMLVTAEKELADRARFLATQARDPAPHYEHTVNGFNYRLSNVLAGIGRGQLRVLKDRVNRRREIFARYANALGDLPGWSFMPEPAWTRSTRWLTCVTIDPAKARSDREGIRLALEGANIEARPVWKPLHLQPVFKGLPTSGGAVSERLFAHGLCLPSGSSMSDADQDRVIAVIRDAVSR